MSSFRRVVRLAFAVACLVPAVAAGQTVAESSPRGTVRGIVVDRAGGAPIADVAIAILDLKLSVKTDRTAVSGSMTFRRADRR